MAWAETSVATALGAPAGTFAHLATARVQTKTADGHEDMLTRLHPDSDEATFASLSVVRKTDRSQRSLEKASLDQGVGSRAAAVISTIFDAAINYDYGPVRVNVAARNIGNRNYVIPFSYFNNAMAPGAPAAVYASASLRF